MTEEQKPFIHIIKLLFKRDGWIKLPLYDKQEVNNDKTT